MKKNMEKTVSLIKDIVKNTDREIKRFALQHYKKELPEYYNIYLSLSKGGKRIRPLLVAAGYLTKKKNYKVVLHILALVEGIHNFLLIHDDIVDNDNLRRGVPTFHIQLKRKKYREAKELAMIFGDLLLFDCLKSIDKIKLPTKNKYFALKTTFDCASRTGLGEILDITNKATNIETLSEKEIFYSTLNKTAFYSFEMPLSVGYALATGGYKGEFRSFALLAGKAFQMQDDLLGIFATQKYLQKPIGSDLKEDRATVFFKRVYTKANAKEKKFLKSVLGKPQRRETLDRVRKIAIKHGVSKKMKKEIINHLNKASKIIEKMKIRKEAKDIVFLVLEMIKKRNKQIPG